MYEATLEKFRRMYEQNEDCCCPAEFIPIEEALKKQIPQKPKDLRSPQDVHFFAMGDCPVCGRTVDSNEQYCFNCGQRLYWEAEK